MAGTDQEFWALFSGPIYGDYGDSDYENLLLSGNPQSSFSGFGFFVDIQFNGFNEFDGFEDKPETGDPLSDDESASDGQSTLDCSIPIEEKEELVDVLDDDISSDDTKDQQIQKDKILKCSSYPFIMCIMMMLKRLLPPNKPSYITPKTWKKLVSANQTSTLVSIVSYKDNYLTFLLAPKYDYVLCNTNRISYDGRVIKNMKDLFEWWSTWTGVDDDPITAKLLADTDVPNIKLVKNKLEKKGGSQTGYVLRSIYIHETLMNKIFPKTHVSVLLKRNALYVFQELINFFESLLE